MSGSSRSFSSGGSGGSSSSSEERAGKSFFPQFLVEHFLHSSSSSSSSASQTNSSSAISTKNFDKPIFFRLPAALLQINILAHSSPPPSPFSSFSSSLTPSVSPSSTSPSKTTSPSIPPTPSPSTSLPSSSSSSSSSPSSNQKTTAKTNTNEGLERQEERMKGLFTELLSSVASHQGDIATIVGNKIIALWPTSSTEEPPEAVLLRASTCALTASRLPSVIGLRSTTTGSNKTTTGSGISQQQQEGVGNGGSGSGSEDSSPCPPPRVSFCVTFGVIYVLVVGGYLKWKYVISGPAVDEAEQLNSILVSFNNNSPLSPNSTAPPVILCSRFSYEALKDFCNLTPCRIGGGSVVRNNSQSQQQCNYVHQQNQQQMHPTVTAFQLHSANKKISAPMSPESLLLIPLSIPSTTTPTTAARSKGSTITTTITTTTATTTTTTTTTTTIPIQVGGGNNRNTHSIGNSAHFALNDQKRLQQCLRLLKARFVPENLQQMDDYTFSRLSDLRLITVLCVRFPSLVFSVPDDSGDEDDDDDLGKTENNENHLEGEGDGGIINYPSLPNRDTPRKGGGTQKERKERRQQQQRTMQEDLERLQRTVNLLQAIVNHFGGSIYNVDTSSSLDGGGTVFVLTFGLCPVHEDDALRGSRVGIEIKRSEHFGELPKSQIGIATGRVLYCSLGIPTRREMVVIGNPVIRASDFSIAVKPETSFFCDETTARGCLQYGRPKLRFEKCFSDDNQLEAGADVSSSTATITPTQRYACYWYPIFNDAEKQQNLEVRL
jgi:class 3 adenylate cyclase